MSDPDDAELLAAWRGGDLQRGNALLERHFSMLLRFLRAGQRFDAATEADLVQRVMMAAVESRATIPEGVRFRAWLLGVARRVLADALRQGYRAQARAAKAWPQSSMASPSTVVAAREEEQLLLGALRELPRDLQVVIGLHYWEELTVREMASVLDLPGGTVKSRLRRAREALAEGIATASAPQHLRHSTLHGLDRWASAVRARVASTSS